MKSKLFLIVLVLMTLQLCAKPHIIAYITNNGDDPTASQVRALTHMNFCFIHPNGDKGELELKFNKSRMEKLISYAKLYDVKALITFGGGGVVMSKELLENDANRQKLVSNLVEFVATYDLDGIDNDWEPDWDSHGGDLEGEKIRYENNVRYRKYYGIIQSELRDSLDARFGVSNKILSAAVGAEDRVYYKFNEHNSDPVVWLPGFWDDCDFVNLMAYGRGGGLEHGDDESAFRTVSYWEDKGMPLEKMVVGAPFYAQASWDHALIDYSEVIAAFPDIDSTIDTVRFDFGEGEQLYGFNSVTSLRKRQDSAVALGLPGLMFWELSQDLPIEHRLSLLRAISPPPENPIYQMTEFDTLVATSSFTKEFMLTDYFASNSGSLKFSIDNTPNRHHCTIEGNKLIITGDAKPDVGITDIAIKATSTISDLDFVIGKLVVIVETRPVFMAKPTGVGPNLILSKRWSISKINDPYMIPAKREQLYKLSNEGDTVLHFLGTIKDAPDWMQISLDYDPTSDIDLGKTPILFEYESDVEGNGVSMSVVFSDKHDVRHKYEMKRAPGVWICDTITPQKLSKAWGQPEDFDHSSIKKISIEVGGEKCSEIYSIALRRFEIDSSGVSILSKSLQSLSLKSIGIQRNELRLSGHYATAHSIKLYSLKGQLLWVGNIKPECSLHTFTIPNLSKGIYLIEISGDVQQSWKYCVD